MRLRGNSVKGSVAAPHRLLPVPLEAAILFSAAAAAAAATVASRSMELDEDSSSVASPRSMLSSELAVPSEAGVPTKVVIEVEAVAMRDVESSR